MEGKSIIEIAVAEGEAEERLLVILHKMIIRKEIEVGKIPVLYDPDTKKKYPNPNYPDGAFRTAEKDIDYFKAMKQPYHEEPWL
jgi:hypothetical protein